MTHATLRSTPDMLARQGTGGFPGRLIRLRRQRNLRQDDLGHAIGVTGVAISLWERGERIPNAASVAALADYFHMSMTYLWTGKRECDCGSDQ